MNTDERREQILYTLKQTNTPITGSELANIFKVSRQIIVGDITVLRASGHNIFATPRGYLLPHDQAKEEQLATIACQHNDDNLQTELEIIIDNGGKVRDVIVEHPLYGEILLIQTMFYCLNNYFVLTFLLSLSIFFRRHENIHKVDEAFYYLCLAQNLWQPNIYFSLFITFPYK